MIADIVDPVTGSRLARSEAHRAEGRAVSEGLGVADTCYIGPEPEFFIFDEVRYEQNQHRGITRSTRSRARGTRRASRSPISDTSRASRAATSR